MSGKGAPPNPWPAAGAPPSGDPWDLPLQDAPLLFLDLEMTGLRPATDRVIEVCAERVRGGACEGSIVSLVRPEPPAFGNAHVHGIDPAALASAPTFAALSDRIERLLEGAIVVAHAAAWDVAFLEAERARCGAQGARVMHALDSLTLSRRAFPFRSHNLSCLCRELGIPRAREHRAEDDVRALRAVFDRVVEVLAPQTPRDLWDVRVGERRARPSVVAALVLAAERGERLRVRYRPAGRGAEELLIVVTGVRTDLDPPRVLGYLLPSRSRRELRADRILAIETAPANAAT